MKPPAIGANETERLAVLRSYEILDTPPEPRFDTLTKLAANILKVPIALITFVDTDRQWFKSRYGLDAPETPRDVSFCGHVVAAEAPLVVPDALQDLRFSDNPLVTGDPKVRFYAGVPLQTPDGFSLGTFCAIDHNPRQMAGAEVETLELLARQVVEVLELQRRHTASEARLRAIIGTAVDAILTIDESGLMEQVNPAIEHIFGYHPSELLGRNVSMLMPSPDREQHDGYLANYAATGARKVIGIGREVTGRRKDGTEFPAELAVSEMLVGARKMFTGIIRDISLRKQAERELNQFRATLDRTNDAILIFDPMTLRFTYANHGAVNHLGYSVDELLQKTPLDLNPQFDETHYREILDPSGRGGAIYQHRARHLRTKAFGQVDERVRLDGEPRAQNSAHLDSRLARTRGQRRHRPIATTGSRVRRHCAVQ